MDRGLAANNPVRQVKFFHAYNERVRYLADEEWERLRAAALKHHDQSPYLLDKMVLAPQHGPPARKSLPRDDFRNWLINSAA